jgi:hypothetical protein
MLQGGRPDLKEINFILQKAAKHGSEGAWYFMMMLLVLSNDGFLVGDAFVRQQLTNCRGAIMNVEGLLIFGGISGPGHFSQSSLTGSFALRTLLVEDMGESQVFIGHFQVLTLTTHWQISTFSVASMLRLPGFWSNFVSSNQKVTNPLSLLGPNSRLLNMYCKWFYIHFPTSLYFGPLVGFK